MKKYWVVSIESSKITTVNKYFKLLFKPKKSEKEIGHAAYI